jgi:hypothetical protein
MKLLQLLPLLSLTACGSAFETGNLFPDDAGSAPDASHEAGLQPLDSGSDSRASEAGMGAPRDAAEDAANDAGNASDAAVEASPPPECSAPRCVDGTTSQSCLPDGNWGPTTNCPYVCEAGACSGVCVPGSTSCGTSDTQLQACSSSGTWVASTCPNACVGGSCVGVCVPGMSQVCYDACSDTGSETCGSNGQWGPCSVSCGN